MKVHLAIIGEQEHADVDHLAEFRWLHAQASEPLHQLVESPAEADLILFVDYQFDTFYRDLAASEVFQKYGGKCFIYDPKPFPRITLPGVYTSSWKWWNVPSPHRSYCLVERWEGFPINPLIEYRPPDASRDLHCVYVGGNTHPMRQHLLELDFGRQDVVLQDTTKKHVHMDFSRGPEQRELALRNYAELCMRTRYMLCPAGVAPNSIRLYEAMKCGCVPVVIADQWDAPLGPDWEQCIIWVGEKQIPHIPEILGGISLEKWQSLALAAREAYLEYFAVEKQFNRLIWLIQDIGAGAAVSCRKARGRPLLGKLLHRVRAKLHAVG